VPTSGRRSCAPGGVGDDSGIVLPIQHERFASSGPSGASRRTLPSATLVLGASVPEPTVFRLKFCSDVLRYAATSRQNFVCDAWDRGHCPPIGNALHMRSPRSGGGALEDIVFAGGSLNLKLLGGATTSLDANRASTTRITVQA